MPTARAAALSRAGRTTRHAPCQASVFCRSSLGLEALLRTVGRPRRSAVKVGRKLEKRAPHAVTNTGVQLRASPAAAGSAATAARSQSTKPGTDGAPLFFGSPALSPGLSRPLGLGWLAARPVCRRPSCRSREARRSRCLSQYRHCHLGHLVAALPQRRHLRSSRS